MELNNVNGKQESISGALQLKIPEHAVISVTGAGGKTSLIFAWARELADAGKKVAVTTTTHMHSPERMAEEPVDLYEGAVLVCCDARRDPSYNQEQIETEPVVPAETVEPTEPLEIVDQVRPADQPGPAYLKDLLDRIDSALDSGGIVFVYSPYEKDPAKVTAPPEEVLEHLYKSADVTLIEADGSRRMPLKWPAPWEPAVPERTDITVCVAGLSSVGKKTEDVIYRADEMPEHLKQETVDVNLLHKMLHSHAGGQKGARGEFRVFLNQVDDDIDRLAASYRLQQILSVFGIQTAWGSLQQNGNTIGQSASQGSLPEQGCTGNSAEIGMEDDNGSGTGDRLELKLAFILEAAGNSTRFGSNKLLYIMDDGRPMASCIMDTVSEAIEMMNAPNVSNRISFRKILVTQYDEVAELAPDFSIVINDRPDLGISRSMQLGIEAAGDADAYMFCVCDQPYTKPESICRMIDEYKKGTAGIVSLAYEGKMYSPKIFSSKYRDELMALSGDTGGRQIIADHRDELSLIEASDVTETADIDMLL